MKRIQLFNNDSELSLDIQATLSGYDFFRYFRLKRRAIMGDIEAKEEIEKIEHKSEKNDSENMNDQLKK